MQRFKVPRACRAGYLTDRLYCLGAAFTKKDLPAPSLFFIKGGDFWMGTSQAAICSILNVFAWVGFPCPDFPLAWQVACLGMQLPCGGPSGARLGRGPSVPSRHAWRPSTVKKSCKYLFLSVNGFAPC